MSVFLIFSRWLNRWLTRVLGIKFIRASNKIEASFSCQDFSLENAIYLFHVGDRLEFATYQITSWLPVLENAGIPFVLIVRAPEVNAWVRRNHPGCNVVLAQDFMAIDELLDGCSHVDLILYSALTANSLDLVKRNSVRHCFIGHGDSEKGTSVNKAMRMFDEIWVAGQAHVDRFRNAGFSIDGMLFRKIGRPALQSVSNRQQREEGTKPRGLYLPTWEGGVSRHAYSSVAHCGVFLGELSARGYRIDVKWHPASGCLSNQMREDIKQVERRYSGGGEVNFIDRSVNIVDIIGDYDFFICDISSVVTDCLSVNVPIFVFEPETPGLVVASSNMSYESYCHVYRAPDALPPLVEWVMAGRDTKEEARQFAARYFIGLGDEKSCSFKEAVNSARKCHGGEEE